jgi:2-polyprenyl-3-methyl-5-hydroxy-6-metoxy-1,4-benzoquinol methylase
LNAADFSPVAVEMGKLFAQARQLANITWTVANIQEMPWPTGTFDAVISCETIEHVPRPRVAVAELARVLRPGGRLFLSTPNYFNLAGVHRIYARWLRGRRFQEEGQPINHFTLLPRVAAWVRRAGMEVLRVRSVNHSIPFPRRPGITLRTLESAPFPFPWLGNNSLILAKKR